MLYCPQVCLLPRSSQRPLVIWYVRAAPIFQAIPAYPSSARIVTMTRWAASSTYMCGNVLAEHRVSNKAALSKLKTTITNSNSKGPMRNSYQAVLSLCSMALMFVLTDFRCSHHEELNLYGSHSC